MAAGAWSGGLLGDIGVHAPTPPLKGQIVLMRHDRPLLARIVEHGKNYLVPRGDGRVLIGATEENAGFDTRPTATAVHDLLGEALRLCPVLGQAQVEAVWAGLRPGSIDTKPYIGLAPGFRNLIVATGHKRPGLQLSPATAELVAALVMGRKPCSIWRISGSIASPIPQRTQSGPEPRRRSLRQDLHEHLGRGREAQRDAPLTQNANHCARLRPVLQHRAPSMQIQSAL